jgi:methionine sulfoxide reductase heme-binding subunit
MLPFRANLKRTVLTQPIVRIPASRWLPAFDYSLLQIMTHIGAWSPLAILIYAGFTNGLTINPIQHITFYTGDTAIRLLLMSLSCTPANTLFGFREAIKLRRPLGVYAFLYAAIHFSIFLFDYSFNPAYLYEAIFEKPYALVGFAALLILLPLALTSTKGMQKRLGKLWKRLHRTVYAAGILVVIHYLWVVKADIRWPLIYGAYLLFLFILRLPAVKHWVVSQRQKLTARAKTAAQPESQD